MIVSKICVVVGGSLSLLMVIFHTRFYKLFDWKDEFEKITPRNQRIFYTIHMALLLLLVVFSILSFVYLEPLSRCSGAAFGIMTGYSLFWLWRTIWQIIYFKPPAKSKRNASTRKLLFLHYFLIVVFFVLFLAYAVPVVLKLT